MEGPEQWVFKRTKKDKKSLVSFLPGGEHWEYIQAKHFDTIYKYLQKRGCRRVWTELEGQVGVTER